VEVEVNHEVDISTCMKIKILLNGVYCVYHPTFYHTFLHSIPMYSISIPVVPGTIIDQESDDLMNLTFALNYVLKKWSYYF